MARSTVTVMLLTGAKFCCALLSHILIAQRFGATHFTDAYFVASTLPLIVVSFFTTIGPSVLVPLFINERTCHGDQRAWQFASTLVAGLLFVVLIVFFLAAQGADFLVKATAPGLSQIQYALAADLTPLFCGVGVCMTFGAMLIGIRHALQQFAVASISLIFMPAGTIAGALFLADHFGIKGLLLGHGAGALLHVAILAWGIVTPGRLWVPTIVRSQNVLTAVKMVLPLLCGGTIYQLLPAIERFYASSLPPGRIYYLSLGNRVGMLLLPLVATALATTLFPRLSTQAANNEAPEACSTLSMTLRLFLVVAVPIVMFSPVYSSVLVSILFERGSFGPEDTAALAYVVPLYTLAASASALGTLLGRGFYAILHDTLTPSINVAIYIILYACVCPWLLDAFGYRGLASAHCLFWVFSIFTAALLLRHRLGSSAGRRVWWTALRCCAAAGIAAALTWAALQITNSAVLSVMLILFGAVIYVVTILFVVRVEAAQFGVNILLRMSWLQQFSRGHYFAVGKG